MGFEEYWDRYGRPATNNEGEYIGEDYLIPFPCPSTSCSEANMKPVVTRTQGNCGSCNLPSPKPCKHPQCVGKNSFQYKTLLLKH